MPSEDEHEEFEKEGKGKDNMGIQAGEQKNELYQQNWWI